MARKSEELLEMLGGRKKLSPMEMEFMKFIWEHPDGISSAVKKCRKAIDAAAEKYSL